ncbi:MAG TPA: hypothetical protein VHR72_12825 [Gemmataceae bacterium]|jgi:hypothetical protein|nr:hypothetical protein [Gemmataceae bacterium]
MRWRFLLLVVSLCPATTLAQENRDPLRFVPPDSTVVAKIECPPKLYDSVYKLDVVRGALETAGVKDFYDSTNYRRFQQLLAYFEKALGKDRYQLLDGLTGGGVSVVGRLEKPGSALLVVQAKDEALLKDFAKLATELVEKELVRQESKEKLRHSVKDGIETFAVGPVRAAIVDGALLVASDDKMLAAALAARKKPAEPDARRTARADIPPSAHAWVWLDLERFRNLPDVKPGFDAAGKDVGAKFIFGGIHDVLRRSPWMTTALVEDGGEWRLSLRMPSGRDGMSPISNLVVPATTKVPGSLPLLRPPRTLASFSGFLDLGSMWDHRKEIFGAKQAEEMDKGEANISKALLGVKIGNLFRQAGPHYRVVFASPEKSPYAQVPGTKIPAFAVVVDMRDPKFGKTVDFFLRGFGLIGVLASKGSVKIADQEHAGVKFLTVRFPEDKPFAGDDAGFRFNYDPCFAIVGDQAIFSSSVELGKDLIDLLKKDSKTDAGSPAVSRTMLYSAGAVHALRAGEDQVLTQLILNQALPPGAARNEVNKIIALVERLGTIGYDVDYREHEFRFDLRWNRRSK